VFSSGLYDGYSLAGTAFIPDAANPANRAGRLIVSVYNGVPNMHGGLLLPPILTLHSDVADDGTGGALLKVYSLFITAGKPVGIVTGVAVTASKILVGEVVGTLGYVVAFDRNEVVGGADGGPAAELTAARADLGGMVMRRKIDKAPWGGLHFVTLGGTECMLFASDGSNVTASATTFVYQFPADCGWFPPVTQKSSFLAGENVMGISLFQHIDTKVYATIVRCKIAKAYDCRLEFSAVAMGNGTAFKMSIGPSLYALSVPTGAAGLSFDDRNKQFVLGFNGADDRNYGAVKSAGRYFEDRIMIISLPVWSRSTGVC
jgi:hypothetical protein